VRLHGSEAREGEEVEAEEAYLSLEIVDRDTNEPWVAESWWLSDIATLEGDSAQVRQIIGGLERTIAKLKSWLSDQEKPGGAQDTAGQNADKG
jgi:hypothetical protein